MDINHNDLVFDAAKDSINRFRWFLLTTTLLSSLIVMHLYLEQFGTIKSQLQETIMDDVKLSAKQLNDKLKEHKSSKSTPASENKTAQYAKDESHQKRDSKIEPELYQGRLADLAMKEKSLIERLALNESGEKAKANSEAIEKELKDFAETKLIYLRTYNDFKDLKLRDRRIPLLDLEMDTNDYVPVIAIMLSIMIAGVWLSASSLEAALRNLANNTEGRPYIEVLKLRFTFLFPGDRGDITCVNNALLYAAVWMPFLTLLGSSFIEFWSTFKDGAGVLPGGALMTFRWAFLVGCLFWSFIFAQLGTLVMIKIKAIAYPAPMPTT